MKKLITIETLVDQLEDYLIESSNYKRVCQILFHYKNQLEDEVKLWMFLPCDTHGELMEKPEYNSDKELEFQAKYAEYHKAEKQVLFKAVKKSAYHALSDMANNGFDYTVGGISTFSISNGNIESAYYTLSDMANNGFDYEFKLTKAGRKYFFGD